MILYGKYVVTTDGSCSEKTIKVWDIKKSKYISKFSIDIKTGIVSLRIAPSSKFIVSFSFNNIFDVYSIDGKHLKHIQFARLPHYSGEFTISSDDKYILIGEKIIDIEHEKIIKLLPKTGDYIFNPFNSDEVIHLEKDDKSRISFFNWKSNKSFIVFDNNLSNYAFKLSANQRYLFISTEKELYILDLKSKKIVQKIENVCYVDDDSIYYIVETTSDNSKLLYKKRDKFVFLDIKSKEVIKRINILKGLKAVNSVSLNGDGKYLAIGLSDSNISIWDINNSKPIANIKEKSSEKIQIALNYSGEHLISFVDSTINIWDTFKEKLLESYEVDDAHDIFYNDNLFFLTPNDRYLIYSSALTTVVWDIKNHQFISTKFETDKDSAFYLNKYLVSILNRDRVFVYNIEDMRMPIREFYIAENNNWLIIDNERNIIYKKGEGVPIFKIKKIKDLKNAYTLLPF